MTTKTPATPAPQSIWIDVHQIPNAHKLGGLGSYFMRPAKDIESIEYVPKAELDAVLALNKTQAETIADYQAHVERLAIGAINSYRRRAVEAIRARIEQRNAHIPTVQVDEIQERLREDCEEDEAVIRLLESLPVTAKEVADADGEWVRYSDYERAVADAAPTGQDNARKAEVAQCPVTCDAFPLSCCEVPHQCVRDAGHPFNAMYGQIHKFESHMLPVKPRATSKSVSLGDARKAAEEIADKWVRHDLTPRAAVMSSTRQQLRNLAEDIISKHCGAVPTRADAPISGFIEDRKRAYGEATAEREARWANSPAVAQSDDENRKRFLEHFMVKVEPHYERKHGKLPPAEGALLEYLMFVQHELERAPVVAQSAREAQVIAEQLVMHHIGTDCLVTYRALANDIAAAIATPAPVEGEAMRRETWKTAIKVAQESVTKSIAASLDVAAAEILIRRLESAALESLEIGGAATSPSTAADAREREASIAFEKWWATKVAEGYQYGRGPLATVRFGFEAGFAASLPVVQSTPTAPTQDATALCTPIRCGTNPVLPSERIGCGQYITSEIDLYRCVDCSTPFHRECLRSHFGEHKAP